MARRRGKRWVAEGYDRATKKKRYLGTFDTQKEAKAAEAAWTLRGKGTSRETCDQFAARWTTDYPRPRASTNKHNAECVRRFAEDFKGVRIGEIQRPVARAWARRNQGALPAVRNMFGDALRDGLVAANPFADLRLSGSPGRKRIVALTESELLDLAALACDDRMVLGAYGPQYRAMILFAGYVGLRPGELFALRRGDVRGQEVTIERALSSRTGEVGPTKTGGWRTVQIPPVAQDALLEVPHHPSGLLFVTPSGKRWSTTSHHYYWKRLVGLAGRPGFDFYELRHACATMMLERGATPSDVAQQLGHSDGGRLVMSTYGHPSEAGARARNLALWDDRVEPLRGRSGAIREQAS
jgi:integrase